MTGKDAVVTRAPQPKLDQTGTQRINKSSGKPLWTTQVCVTDQTGGEIISVATEGISPPDVDTGEEVELTAVVAIPWATNGRSGVSYRAQAVKAVDG